MPCVASSVPSSAPVRASRGARRFAHRSIGSEHRRQDGQVDARSRRVGTSLHSKKRSMSKIVQHPGSSVSRERGGVEGDEAASVRDERWSRVCRRLRAELGEEVFTSWFARLELDGILDETAHLSVPTRFLKSWIQSHYTDRLLATVAFAMTMARSRTQKAPMGKPAAMPLAQAIASGTTSGQPSECHAHQSPVRPKPH